MAALEFPPIKLTLSDGQTLTADIWPADLYRYEEYANVSLSSIGQGLSFRHLLPLAFFALRRSGQVPPDKNLDDFANQVKGLDVDGSAANGTSPNPSELTPSTG